METSKWTESWDGSSHSSGSTATAIKGVGHCNELGVRKDSGPGLSWEVEVPAGPGGLVTARESGVREACSLRSSWRGGRGTRGEGAVTGHLQRGERLSEEPEPLHPWG